MHSHYLNFDFGKLHYQCSDIDSGKETLLLLHATCSSAASFVKLEEVLKERFNLIALDLPGHGLSARLEVPKFAYYYTLPGLIEVFLHFLEQLQLKNIFIAANSLGANIAIRALPAYTFAKGLILLSSIHAENKEAFVDSIILSEAQPLVGKKDLSLEECVSLAGYYVYDTQQASFRQMVDEIKHTDGNFREQFGRSVQNDPWPNEFEFLQASHLPVLYIGGKKDAFIKPQYYDRLVQKEILPASNLHLLEGVGHVPHAEDPQSTAAFILKFINGL